jgi:hypothetical protein
MNDDHARKRPLATGDIDIRLERPRIPLDINLAITRLDRAWLFAAGRPSPDSHTRKYSQQRR